MRSTIVRLAAEATHSRTPMIHFLGKRANLEYSQSSYLGISLVLASKSPSHSLLNSLMLCLHHPQSLTPRAPTQPLLKTSSTTSNPSSPNSKAHPPLPTAPPVTRKDNLWVLPPRGKSGTIRRKTLRLPHLRQVRARRRR
jgi:hypothetical protein